MTEFTIRDATTKDIPEILKLLQTAFANQRELDPPSGVFKETIDSLTEKLSTGGGFIVEADHHIVGYVFYQPNNDHMYLGRLATHPDYRGQGIARILINKVESLAREQKQPQISLGVRIALNQNREMFESRGFKLVSYEMHEGYTEPTFIWMAKHLSDDLKHSSGEPYPESQESEC